MKFEQCKSGAIITVHSGGPRGPKGEQGIPGIQGEKGDTGEVGPKGDTGEVTQEEFDDLKDQVALDKLDYAELNNRVDAIITTPVTDISVQEIVDARQGELSLGANLTGVKGQIDKLTSKLNIIPSQAQINKLSTYKKKLSFPAGFTWTTAPINIYKDIAGNITTDFDVSQYKYIGAGKTYYVSMTGSDANDGLTEANALYSLSTAISKPDVDIIIISGGYYARQTAFNSFPINRNMSIVAKTGEKVVLSCSENLTWTKTDGKTNVYQASRTNVASVYDKTILDEYGDYLKLTKLNSIEDVDLTPSTYYYDTINSILYVHAPNSKIVVDTEIRAMLDTTNIKFNADVLYLEGIDFEGGKEVLNYTSAVWQGNAKIYAKNCTFKYSSLQNGVHLFGLGEAYFQECLVARNYLDGFNYHLQNGTVPKVIEVDCISRHNGLEINNNSNNGSTGHDGAKIIRVNGEYYKNEGPNVADVNDFTQSWNVGVLAHDSLAKSISLRIDFMVANSNTETEMWLDNCIGYGSQRSLAVYGNAYVNGNLFLSSEFVETYGTKVSYES